MRPLTPGRRFAHRVMPTREETAAALGNTGVEVVATTALILYFEEACHLAIEDCYEAGEASVGTKVEVEHLSPAYVGQPLEIAVELTVINGRRADFKVEARQADRLVMAGDHQRAVIDLSRFLGGAKPAEAMPPQIDFWFDFHSPWCYLASTRIGDIARRHGASLAWRPVHLPKLMDAVDGRRPLEANPAFVRWHKQDLADQAALLGLPLAEHPRYPLRPARAQRLAYYAASIGKAEAFVRSLMQAYWSESADIEDLALLARHAAKAGIEPERVPAIVADETIKAGLEANLEEAVRSGLFGLPTAVFAGKLFFGNDHLDLLEHWLRRGDRAPAQ